MQHIGKRLKDLMAVRKVTTSAMAVHCDVTRGAVSNWFVTGRITKENLAKAAEKLRTTTDRLIKYDAVEILELEAEDRKAGARAVAPMLDAARENANRRSYSLQALELALMFDELSDELSRRRAIAYVENLLGGNPELRATSSSPVQATPEVPSRRSSSRPSAVLKDGQKKSLARRRI